MATPLAWGTLHLLRSTKHCLEIFALIRKKI
jgi:hypothetical protein